jgi:hypothetical protein
MSSFAPLMVEAAIDQRRRFAAGAAVGWSESPGRPTYDHQRSHGPNKNRSVVARRRNVS